MVEYANESMPRLIRCILTRRGASNFSLAYMRLATEQRVLAMRAKYIDGSDERFRQHMYVVSKLEIESVRLDEQHVRFETGVELWHALLSDSREMIEKMARFAPVYYAGARHDPLNPQFMVHMWQLAILGEYDALEEKIGKLAKNGRKPMRTLCAEKKDFFSLLMRADKAGLEARIMADSKRDSGDPITNDFFAYTATFEAKLCWYKGIEVQIDSPRVPMDLMPIRPLAHYDDVYDFLKPGWVPPPQGIVARVSQWFKR